MGDDVGQVTVVGEHDQAGRIGIESTHWKHPRVVGDQLDNRWAVMGIGRRTQRVQRLVQQVVGEIGRGREGNTVHANSRMGRIDLLSDMSGLAVDLYPPAKDHLFRNPPRCKPAAGDDLLQAFRRRRLTHRS